MGSPRVNTHIAGHTYKYYLSKNHTLHTALKLLKTTEQLHSTLNTELKQQPPAISSSKLAMDMGRLELSPSSSSSTSASSSSSDNNSNNKAACSPSSSSPQPAKKRPAGRTKFRETRHPVFRGVRRRGAAGRWVCEVRVPGNRGARLWLGTYVAAEAAARAHDAAMLALGRGAGRSPGAAGCLNFLDSARLLAVPPPSALSTLDDARRAALEAVADFQRRFGASSGAVAAVDEVTSCASAPPPLPEISGSPAATSSSLGDHAPVKADEPAAALDVEAFEPDWFGGMDLDTYYASLAEGLLMEPPPAPAAWEHGEIGDGGADVALWSY